MISRISLGAAGSCVVNGPYCIGVVVFSQLTISHGKTDQPKHFVQVLEKCKHAGVQIQFLHWGGGGIIGQILPKFAISRVLGYDFLIK